MGIVIIHDLGILFEFVAKGSFPGSWPWLVKTESGWGNLKELGRAWGVGFAWHRRWKDVDFLRVFHVKNHTVFQQNVDGHKESLIVELYPTAFEISTWMCIPYISRDIPYMTGAITHLLSVMHPQELSRRGCGHQVMVSGTSRPPMCSANTCLLVQKIGRSCHVSEKDEWWSMMIYDDLWLAWLEIIFL